MQAGLCISPSSVESHEFLSVRGLRTFSHRIIVWFHLILDCQLIKDKNRDSNKAEIFVFPCSCLKLYWVFTKHTVVPDTVYHQMNVPPEQGVNKVISSDVRFYENVSWS